ncbi:MAG: hypothetical protein ER33_03995 [Cyanobium sp. CACIAM 14]|nr:MAG: hypothetical protein ER33_03995 [Cyanobium sp. CACIAM 14]
MGSDLSFVNSTESGCQIFRDTSGCYVVSHALNPGQRAITATLAGAYAACQGWERRIQPCPADSGG